MTVYSSRHEGAPRPHRLLEFASFDSFGPGDFSRAYVRETLQIPVELADPHYLTTLGREARGVAVAASKEGEVVLLVAS